MDDDIEQLLEEESEEVRDVIIQSRDRESPTYHPIPEHRLLVKVLSLSVKDLLDPESIDLYFDAVDFFRDTTIEPFSFRWICEYLDIDTGKILAALRPPDPVIRIGRTGASEVIYPL